MWTIVGKCLSCFVQDSKFKDFLTGDRERDKDLVSFTIDGGRIYPSLVTVLCDKI